VIAELLLAFSTEVAIFRSVEADVVPYADACADWQVLVVQTCSNRQQHRQGSQGHVVAGGYPALIADSVLQVLAANGLRRAMGAGFKEKECRNCVSSWYY